MSAAEDSEEEEVPLAGPSVMTKEGTRKRQEHTPGPDAVAQELQSDATTERTSPSPSRQAEQLVKEQTPSPVALSAESAMGSSASRQQSEEEVMLVDEDAPSNILIQEPDRVPTAVEVGEASSTVPATIPAKAEEIADEDASMDMEPESDDILEVTETAIQPTAGPSKSPKVPSPEPPKYIPIHIPLPPSIHEDILIPTPTPTQNEDEFHIDAAGEPHFETVVNEAANDSSHFDPHYTLPPLSVLPPDFIRKSKLPKRSKKEKEGKKDKDKDDSVPMGIYKWGATLQVNPVWKKVARSTKCLSTREWGVCMISPK